MAIDGGRLPPSLSRQETVRSWSPTPRPARGSPRERQRDLRAQADQPRLDGMHQRIGFLRVADPAAPGARAVRTRDHAIYESLRLSEAEADFSRRYPDFDPDGALAELRRLEYGRLDEGDQVYLDYTGGGLHAASQIDAHAELLRARVLGNPHSNNPTSLASTELVERARRVVREFFNAPPDEYLCVFTANASAALRLVGESYRFAPRRHVRADRGQPQLGQRHPGVRPAPGRQRSSMFR